MANITEISGTDSVSTSRPTINSNFELLNDELASVIALLNPTTSVLSGLSSATTSSLTVNDGTNLLVANSSGLSVSTAAAFAGNVSLGGRIAKSGVVGTASTPAANLQPSEITKGSYFINAGFTIPTAVDGTEVTLINAATGAVTVQNGTGATIAATSMQLDGVNSTLTLRCFENKWYIISAYACTIS